MCKSDNKKSDSMDAMHHFLQKYLWDIVEREKMHIFRRLSCYTSNSNADHSQVDRKLWVQNQNWLRDWSWETRMACGLSALGFYTDALNSYTDNETRLSSRRSPPTSQNVSRRDENGDGTLRARSAGTRQAPHKRRPSSLARITFKNIIFFTLSPLNEFHRKSQIYRTIKKKNIKITFAR